MSPVTDLVRDEPAASSGRGRAGLAGIAALKRYLDVIVYKAGADLRAERERTYLGLLWWIFEPLLYMVVFWLVFERLLQRGGEGYVQFVLVGLVSWQWIKSGISHCAGSIMEARTVIQHVALPPAIFPLVVVLTDTVKFVVVLTLLLLALGLSGVPVSPSWLSLPLVLLVQLACIAAASAWLAALVPFVPDLRLAAETVLMALMFLSGIFFRASALPEHVQAVFFLNPVAFLIEQNRRVLLRAEWPDWAGLAVLGCGALLVLAAAIGTMQVLRRYYPKLPA